MKAYWYTENHKSDYGNVGDMLTPIIIKHLTGERPEWVEHTTPGKILAVGSLIEFIQDDDEIWGSGLIQPMPIPKRKNVKILAVRGKKTADALRQAGYDVPEVYGDPAVLMPEIYQPTTEKIYDIGYCPHYIEFDAWAKAFPEGRCILINNYPQRFIDEIWQYRKIVTSSLHAYILAQAYGIEAEYLQLTSKIIGGYFKYEDYISGRGDNIISCQQGLKKVFLDHYKK